MKVELQSKMIFDPPFRPFALVLSPVRYEGENNLMPSQDVELTRITVESTYDLYDLVHREELRKQEVRTEAEAKEFNEDFERLNKEGGFREFCTPWQEQLLFHIMEQLGLLKPEENPFSAGTPEWFGPLTEPRTCVVGSNHRVYREVRWQHTEEADIEEGTLDGEHWTEISRKQHKKRQAPVGVFGVDLAREGEESKTVRMEYGAAGSGIQTWWPASSKHPHKEKAGAKQFPDDMLPTGVLVAPDFCLMVENTPAMCVTQMVFRSASRPVCTDESLANVARAIQQWYKQTMPSIISGHLWCETRPFIACVKEIFRSGENMAEYAVCGGARMVGDDCGPPAPNPAWSVASDGKCYRQVRWRHTEDADIEEGTLDGKHWVEISKNEYENQGQEDSVVEEGPAFIAKNLSHDFSFSKSDGYGVCICGARENTEAAGEPCPLYSYEGEGTLQSASHLSSYAGCESACEAACQSRAEIEPQQELFDRLYKYEAGEGARLVAEERLRQITGEGFDAAHDDKHTKRELAQAAARLADPSGRAGWPGGWDLRWDKRCSLDLQNLTLPLRAFTLDGQIDLMVKAGALICAEIDRLKRLEPTVGEEGTEDANEGTSAGASGGDQQQDQTDPG